MAKDHLDQETTLLLRPLFEPTFAHARWALMHHFASVCHWTKIHWIIIHISGSITPRVMEFSMVMIYLDNIWVDLEGHGHRSKVKVMKSKRCVLGDFA